MNMSKEEYESLSITVKAYFDCIQERVDLDGKLGMKKDKTLKKNTPDRDPILLTPLMEYRDGRELLGKELLKDITKIIQKEPLWTEFLSEVSGCGPSTAAVILTQFDIHKKNKHGGELSVSDLVSFAGLAPGKDRKEKGKKCPYNQFLRAKLCGVLGSSFLKCKSKPYSVYFYNERTRLENSDNEVTERLRKVDRKKKEYKGQTTRVVKWRDAYPAHRKDAAIRKMIKEFLKDLYVAWRTIEGLPVRKPYSEEYLGKKHGRWSEAA